MFPIRTHRSTGILSQSSGAAAAILRARAAEWDIALRETAEALVMPVWGSELRLMIAEGDVRIELTAPEQRLIGTLQDSATELFESHGLSIRWDHVDKGALAPGLSLMQVVSVTPRTPGFIRVRLRGPEAPRFADGGLHFRLLLARPGRPPLWPRIAANGRAQWPEGEDALHRPVYTVVRQQDDWLDFDIFRHSGSPTCDWADRATAGETVGIMGPGGGGCPEGARLWLFGDETALPAIARMLTLSPVPVQAFLRGAPADLADLAHSPRVTPCADLLGALAAIDPDPADYVWFAGPAPEARAARQYLTVQGHPKRQFTAAAYWEPSGSPDGA